MRFFSLAAKRLFYVVIHSFIPSQILLSIVLVYQLLL